MTEWRDCKFGEIATFSYGKMPNKKNIVNCGYPIFSGYKIVGYYNSYMYEDPQLIIVARGVGGTGDVKISPPKSYITNLSIIAEVHPGKGQVQFCL
jgi:type I restriction enzyme S subunit